MSWPLYLALKQLFPSGRKLPTLFFFVSVLGVALGVMILVIVQSVMGGFGETYREMIVDTNGHLRIETGAIMYDYQRILEKLDKDPRVAGASPYAQGVVMLQHVNRPAFPFIRGIDLARERKTIPMDKFMVQGKLDDLNDDSILLSSELAGKLACTVGSVVEVYTPIMLEKLRQNEVLLPHELRVAGIYTTGWNQFDSSTMVGTLALMQDLYAIEGGIHGITVRLQPGVEEIGYTMELNANLARPARGFTWLDQYQDFLWVLKLEKNMMLFLLLFIVLVAAFAIAIAQLLTVVRKTREIGLIGAIGGSSRDIAFCYCFQGWFIGVLGTAGGIGLGVLALSFRNPIIHGFARLTNSEATLVKFYQFSNLPVHYTAMDFIIISIASITLATLAGLLPAWRAARLRPAEALRSE
ncbi:MAG: FtsX-like permease family protein [Verrucomicrobiota bacterium]|nr:FtsX-like permease family protein [Verrucomicrobiota bacterium]